MTGTNYIGVFPSAWYENVREIACKSPLLLSGGAEQYLDKELELNHPLKIENIAPVSVCVCVSECVCVCASVCVCVHARTCVDIIIVTVLSPLLLLLLVVFPLLSHFLF